jgi:hypothetical protein
MTDKITAQDIRDFRREIIEWYIRRPIYSCITGKLIGYIKLEVK